MNHKLVVPSLAVLAWAALPCTQAKAGEFEITSESVSGTVQATYSRPFPQTPQSEWVDLDDGALSLIPDTGLTCERDLAGHDVWDLYGNNKDQRGASLRVNGGSAAAFAAQGAVNSHVVKFKFKWKPRLIGDPDFGGGVPDPSDTPPASVKLFFKIHLRALASAHPNLIHLTGRSASAAVKIDDDPYFTASATWPSASPGWESKVKTIYRLVEVPVTDGEASHQFTINSNVSVTGGTDCEADADATALITARVNNTSITDSVNPTFYRAGSDPYAYAVKNQRADNGSLILDTVAVPVDPDSPYGNYLHGYRELSAKSPYDEWGSVYKWTFSGDGLMRPSYQPQYEHYDTLNQSIPVGWAVPLRMQSKVLDRTTIFDVAARAYDDEQAPELTNRLTVRWHAGLENWRPHSELEEETITEVKWATQFSPTHIESGASATVTCRLYETEVYWIKAIGLSAVAIGSVVPQVQAAQWAVYAVATAGVVISNLPNYIDEESPFSVSFDDVWAHEGSVWEDTTGQFTPTRPAAGEMGYYRMTNAGRAARYDWIPMEGDVYGPQGFEEVGEWARKRFTGHSVWVGKFSLAVGEPLIGE